MDTATSIDQLDNLVVPGEIGIHARVVITLWLQHAHVAKEKSDLYQYHRLLALARRKIADEMAKTRPCVEG